MRILLIKPKHIGDTLLLTPAIAAIREAHPGAEIWVIVRAGTEGILAGCPDIARVLTLAGVEKNDRRPGDFWRQVGILLQMWRVKFDYVFELGDGHRGRLFAMLARAKRRFSVRTGTPLRPFDRSRFNAVSSFDWHACHRVEKDFYSIDEFLPLPHPIPPLIFARDHTVAWAPAEKLNRFAVMQVGTRQGFNRWDRERWREVGAHLLTQLDGLVLTCGPVDREREEADWLQRELGERVLSTDGRASWPQMAWLFYHAQLYVGPSTAALHLAAACHCPAVAIFGPTIEDHWAPWRVPYRVVTEPGYVPDPEPEKRYEQARHRTMERVRVADVIAACDELLREGRPAGALPLPSS